jgi:4-hydroxy-tetrahydrodipicolinate synthase
MTAPSILRGVFAPTLTPLKEDLSPDADRWIAHSKRLLNDGCHGLVPFGTTSEANSFGVEERMDLLEMLVDAGVSPDRLLPGTGLCALPETVRLTSHAVELGCAGVLMLPPFYYKQNDATDEGLFRSIAEVIERVGDERLRIYLYHIPPIAQVGYNIGLIERLVSAYPDVVVGIKDSSGDWNNLHNILTNFPGFATFTGSERFLIQTLRLGGAGTITAMANVVPRTLRQLYDNWKSENAQTLQEDVNRFRGALDGYSPIPALKAVVAFRQSDPVWRTVRPPLVEFDDAQAQDVLEKCGLCGEREGVTRTDH